MQTRLRFRRTTLLIVGCVGFLVGLWLSLVVIIPIVVVLLAVPFVIISFPRRGIVACFSIIVLAVSLGIVRGNMFVPKVGQYTELHNQKVTIRLIVDSDAVYDKRKQLSFEATQLELIEPYQQHLVGKMRIGGFGESAIYKGDDVIVSGKLYKTRGSKQASISFAQVKLIKRSGSRVDDIRRRFAAGLSNTLPDPQAPFGLGLLIGQRSTLGENATGWLAAVGLTHIIAVSGYNLTIIVRFVHRLMAKRSRYQTLLFTSLLIGAFLLMTGFSASIVRAAIVCGLSLVAWYYGHTFRPLLLLLLTACITAGWYPIYLWSDIGWYLSFLAFFGVLILAPLVVVRFWRKQPKPLTMVVVESASAQLMTLPVILYIFNETSLIALVSNILVVPFIPLAMLLTLLAGLAGMIAPSSLGIVALPARIILTYVLDIARVLSEIPHMRVTAQLPLGGMTVIYAAIAIFCVTTWAKIKQKHAIITEKNLI